jgi:molybdopterin/thiamine biosynthesis adenylyltransferase
MTSGERERYSRQILFREIGEQGQERLLASHAVIVGCGALGSLQAMALARAGVGRLTIIDRDYVEQAISSGSFCSRNPMLPTPSPRQPPRNATYTA